MAIGAAVVALRGHTSLSVRKMGKLATLLLYTAVAWFFIGASWSPGLIIAWGSGIPGVILYYVVAVQYARDAAAAISERGRASNA